MKKISWLILIVLAISLFVGAFSGCSGNEDKTSNLYNAQFNYETEEGVKETVLIHLDFDGGVSSSYSSTITLGIYGEKLTGIPLDLVKEGYEFIGFYTEPNCTGYQITDKDGFINNREILDETIYGVVKGSTESITLYAGFVAKKIQVTLLLDSNSYVVEVESGEYLNAINLGEITALSYSINPSGKPVFNQVITENIQLYVVSYESTHSGVTICCADNNGYNSKESGSNENIKLNKGWALGNVKLGVERVSSTEMVYSLNYYLLEDTHNLPKGKTSNLNCVWLNSDSYSERIKGTNINNKRIGYGAYYVEVVFDNGFSKEFSDVNFLASSSQYDDIELCEFSVKNDNPIKKINVSIMYELSFNNKYSYWLGAEWASNYRCDYSISF